MPQGAFQHPPPAMSPCFLFLSPPTLDSERVFVKHIRILKAQQFDRRRCDGIAGKIGWPGV
eukprot:4628649-Pleurochrysis_carterae.AAC.3